MTNSFRNKYFFLSNFFPCIITYRGIAYRSVESAFQVQKADTGLSEDARLKEQKRELEMVMLSMSGTIKKIFKFSNRGNHIDKEKLPRSE